MLWAVIATPTELYDLDPSKDLLFEINPPNAGTLVEPQDIKLKIEGDGGFDIAPRNANVTTDIALGLYHFNPSNRFPYRNRWIETIY